jgi:hypothetical protein
MTDDRAAEPSPTEALRAFAARLGDLAGELESDRFPSGPADRASGVRHALRQVVMAVEGELEHADARSPSFHAYEQPWRQWGGPNPDNVYLRAAIDPAGTYRVWGDVRGVRAAIFSLVDGDMHLGKFGVFSECTLADLGVDPVDGTLEIWVTPDERAGNVMAMHPDARMLLIRQYQSDWENDRIATFNIERVDAGAGVVNPTGAGVVAALDRAGEWVARSLSFWRDYAEAARARSKPNTFGPPSTPPGGAPTIAYGAGWWEVPDGHALVITSDVPDADYWGWTIHTRWWLDSGAFDVRSTSVNHRQARADADGRYRIVVSATDPATANWIDITGNPGGLLVYRYVGARTRPVPSGELVALADLRAHLPADHAFVTPAQRAEQLRRRRVAVHAR